MQSSKKISIFVLGQERCLNNHNVHELLIKIWLMHKQLLKNFEKQKIEKKQRVVEKVSMLYSQHINVLRNAQNKLQEDLKKITDKSKITKKEKKTLKEVKEKINAIEQQIVCKEELCKNKHKKYNDKLRKEKKAIAATLLNTVNDYIFYEQQSKAYIVPKEYKPKFFCHLIKLLDKFDPGLMIKIVTKSHYVLIEKLKHIILTSKPDKISLAIDSSLDLSRDLLTSAKGFTSSYLNLYMIREALSQAVQREVDIVKFTLADIAKEKEEGEYHLDQALRFYGFNPKAKSDEALKSALLKARKERRDIKAAVAYTEYWKIANILEQKKLIADFLKLYPNSLKYKKSLLEEGLFKNQPRARGQYNAVIEAYHDLLLRMNAVDVLLKMGKDTSGIISIFALLHHILSQKDYDTKDTFTFHVIHHYKETIENIYQTFCENTLLLPAVKLFIYYYNSPEFIERGSVEGNPKVKPNPDYKNAARKMIETCETAANSSIYNAKSYVNFSIYHSKLSPYTCEILKIIRGASSQEVKTRLSNSSGSPNKRMI